MNEIRIAGPLFTGRAAAETQIMARDIEREIAQDAVNRIKERLGDVLQHPTGYYESQIQTDRSSDGSYRVTDGGVIYGPWLEGTSSRNQTTRFKGYFTFRQVKQDIDSNARETANRIALKHMGAMN
jgi:hypothetical protein